MSRAEEFRSRIQGVWTALITPYDAGGNVSLQGTEQHVDFQISQNIDAIVPASTMGEFPLLSEEERSAVLGTAIRAAQGRCLVIANITANDIRETIRLGVDARNKGADGVIIMLPPFFALDEDEQFDYFQGIMKSVKLPAVIYSSENVASSLLSLPLLDRLVGLDNVCGIKEAIRSAERVCELASSFGNRLPVIAAAEMALPDVVSFGIRATLTASSCFAPILCRSLMEAARTGYPDTNIAEAFYPIRLFRNLFQNEVDRGFPRYIPWTKAACEWVGLQAGPPRKPIAGLRDWERERLRAVLPNILVG